MADRDPGESGSILAGAPRLAIAAGIVPAPVRRAALILRQTDPVVPPPGRG